MRVVLCFAAIMTIAMGCARAERSHIGTLEARLSNMSGPPYAIGSSVGDWVEYRYEGTFQGRPFIVRKQVMSVAANEMIVEITIIREGRKRTWRELITVARGSVMQDEGSSKHVPGVPPSLPFHAWILGEVIIEEGVGVRPCTLKIAGNQYSCECRSGNVTWRGRRLSFVDPICPGFAWGHGPARYRDVATGEVVLEVEVLRAGRMYFRARDLESVEAGMCGQ